MKLTNHLNLPEPFYQAVLNDKYSRGDAHYSASDLIRPPRITILSRRHWDEIEEDVSERIWSLLGKSVHAILEAAEPDNALIEERLFCKVGGRTISGASDLYHDGTISDYKVTSVWTKLFGSRIEQWTQQLNVYAFLFDFIGFPVNALRIICIYRDWSSSQTLKNHRLPQLPVEVIHIPLWSATEQERFIQGRVESLKAAEKSPDDKLPACSYDDMWGKPTTYAVMKSGRRSAIRVCETEIQAGKYANDNPGAFIQVRPGERTRCEKYCSVAKYCNQFHDYKSAQPKQI